MVHWKNAALHADKTKNPNKMKEVTIKVPEGVDRFTVILGDGYQLVTNEEENNNPYGFKDGDIITGSSLVANSTVVIYAKTGEEGNIETHAVLSRTGVLDTEYSERGWGFTRDYAPSDEKDRKRLFDALAEKGLKWNAEEKKMEKLPRWRADEDGVFYRISALGKVSENIDEHDDDDCDNLYCLGNYFKTREAAEKVAGQIREIFKNSKAE